MVSLLRTWGSIPGKRSKILQAMWSKEEREREREIEKHVKRTLYPVLRDQGKLLRERDTEAQRMGVS